MRQLKVLATWELGPTDEFGGQPQQSKLLQYATKQVRDISDNPGPGLLTPPNANVFWVRCTEAVRDQIEADPDTYILSDDLGSKGGFV